MELIAVLLYLLLRQVVDLTFEYLRSKVPPPEQLFDDIDKRKPYK